MLPFKFMGVDTINIAAPTITFQKINLATCNILILFHESFSYLFRVSSASRPLVPQEISSILHKAKVFKMFK